MLNKQLHAAAILTTAFLFSFGMLAVTFSAFATVWGWVFSIEVTKLALNLDITGLACLVVSLYGLGYIIWREP